MSILLLFPAISLLQTLLGNYSVEVYIVQGPGRVALRECIITHFNNYTLATTYIIIDLRRARGI